MRKLLDSPTTPRPALMLLIGSLLAFGGCSYSPTHGSDVLSPIAPSEQGWRSRLGASLQLYVADDGTNVLYRFPLSDGIPAASPASSLQLEDNIILSLAFGSDGSVYSGYYDSHIHYFVDTYAPGSTGNTKPTRTLEITSTWLSYIWVDRLGYLYVSGWKNGIGPSIDIYAPGAQGADLPVQVISPNPDTRASRVVRNDEGQLFVALFGRSRKTYVYADPIRAPHVIRSFCGPRDAVYLAIDDEAELFEGEQQFTDPNHGSVQVLNARDRKCPSEPLRSISPTGYDIDYVENVATHGKFLYAAMHLKGGSFEIFTFDKHLGAQVPLNVLTMEGRGTDAHWIGLAP